MDDKLYFVEVEKKQLEEACEALEEYFTEKLDKDGYITAYEIGEKLKEFIGFNFYHGLESSQYGITEWPLNKEE